jgi:hypothetical protein
VSETLNIFASNMYITSIGIYNTIESVALGSGVLIGTFSNLYIRDPVKKTIYLTQSIGYLSILNDFDISPDIPNIRYANEGFVIYDTNASNILTIYSLTAYPLSGVIHWLIAITSNLFLVQYSTGPNLYLIDISINYDTSFYECNEYLFLSDGIYYNLDLVSKSQINPLGINIVLASMEGNLWILDSVTGYNLIRL